MNDTVPFPRIQVLLPYFGAFPANWSLTLASMGYNSEIDWTLFTDQQVGPLPANVTLVSCQLSDIRVRAEEAVGTPISLEHAYKLCDLRPAFGVIFADVLEGYEFWGYCDADVVFGDLKPDVLEALESGRSRIFQRGHLSLIANTPSINQLFKVELPGVVWREIFANPRSCLFDEGGGWYDILESSGVETFENQTLFDIVPKDFRLHARSSTKKSKDIFYSYRSGRVLELLRSSSEVIREGRYIHLQKRPLILEPSEGSGEIVVFGPTGIIRGTSIADGLKLLTKQERSLSGRFAWQLFHLTRKSKKAWRAFKRHPLLAGIRDVR